MVKEWVKIRVVDEWGYDSFLTEEGYKFYFLGDEAIIRFPDGHIEICPIERNYINKRHCVVTKSRGASCLVDISEVLVSAKSLEIFIPKRTRCSICKQPGHNKRTCNTTKTE